VSGIAEQSNMDVDGDDSDVSGGQQCRSQPSLFYGAMRSAQDLSFNVMLRLARISIPIIFSSNGLSDCLRAFACSAT